MVEKNQVNLLKKFDFKRYHLLNDPGSIKDINERFVNINRQIKHWKKVLEVYSPNHTRSFCYIDDAIEQIFRISNSNYKNEIFNIGNDNEEIKIISLAKKILCHLQLNKKIVQKNITKGSPSRRILDIKKIFKIIKIKKKKIEI